MQSFIKIGAVVFELSCRQPDKQTDKQTGKRRAKYNLLAQVKVTSLCSVSKIRQNIHSLFQQSPILPFRISQLHKMAIKQLNEWMNEWMNEWIKKRKLKRIRFKPMFLLSSLTNEDSYNSQIIQCVKDTIFRNGSWYTRFWNRFWNFRTGSLEPVPTSNHYEAGDDR